MASLTEHLQSNIRVLTGSAGTVDEDWHSLFNFDNIPQGEFDERLLQWINFKLGTSYDNLADAATAYALTVESVPSWFLVTLDTFNPEDYILGEDGSPLLLESGAGYVGEE